MTRTHWLLEQVPKVKYIITDSSNVHFFESTPFRSHFEGSVVSTRKEQKNEVPSTLPIVPSISENDEGSFGFMNSGWKSNRGWRDVLSSAKPKQTRHSIMSANTTQPLNLILFGRSIHKMINCFQINS